MHTGNARCKRMRVLYSFPHAIGAPGIGTTAVQQVRGLLNRGHDVQVVAASVHPNADFLADVIKTMVLAGLRVPHRALGMDRTMAYHDLRVASHLRRHSADYDVVHCWPGAALHTARAAAKSGLPTLREVPNTHTGNAYDVVGKLCAELGIHLPKNHSHSLNVGRLQREEAEYAAVRRLLVPSDHVRSTFLARGFSPERLLRHQYGFDADVFTPREAPRSGPFHAVFLGTVEPRKGLHVALEAWRRSEAFKTATFSIYGRVVDGYGQVIEQYLDMPNVELFGFTDDTAGVLRSADVLILPSYEEGSALVTYEAQGCGAVPMVSDATGAQCVHGVTGMIHPAGDVVALTEQLKLLISDRSLLNRLSRSVLQERDHLTWAAAAERLEQCYEQAIQAR